MRIAENLLALFQRKTPSQKAAAEIAESQMARMDAQAAAEYADAIAGYHDARIKRQKLFLTTCSRPETLNND